MKQVKSKKFVGYVPKGETLKETLDEYRQTISTDKHFGMGHSVQSIIENVGCKKVVKRTITIS